MTEISKTNERALDEDHANVDFADAPTTTRDVSEPELEGAGSSSPADARSRSRHAAARRTEPQRKGLKITRTDVNFWLDTSLLMVFMALVFVTIVVRFIFPSVEDADQWRLWSWTMTQWLDAQFVILSLFSLGILLHLMLHWTWICGVITQRVLPSRGKKQVWDDGKRTIFGVGLMIVIFNILGGLIAAAALMIQHP